MRWNDGKTNITGMQQRIFWGTGVGLLDNEALNLHCHGIMNDAMEMQVQGQ